MLLVYGDESFDETQERVCAVAGVIGAESEWCRIEPLWEARNGPVPFHARDCEADCGDYESATHAANQELYRDLTIMLADSSLSGYAAVTDLAAERKYFPNSTVLYLREFSFVIRAMQYLAKDLGEMAEMCFDSRAETDHNAALLYANARSKDPNWQPFLASRVSFESSRKNARLQIADLFAREAMKVLDNEIGPVKRPPRKSWLALEATRRFSLGEFREQSFIDERAFCVSNVDRGREEYAGYLRWLEEKRRQPNISNLIDYTGR